MNNRIKQHSLGYILRMPKSARAGSTSVLLPNGSLFLRFIGILMTLSIAACYYETVRSQVSEGLNLTGEAKAVVTEYYFNYKAFPSDNTSAGIAPSTEIQGKYVSSVQIESGEIVVTFGNDAVDVIQGATLVIRPVISSESVTWFCSSPDIAARNLPAVCK